MLSVIIVSSALLVTICTDIFSAESAAGLYKVNSYSTVFPERGSSKKFIFINSNNSSEYTVRSLVFGK